MTDPQELEFRGRVLATLEDVQRRLQRVEDALSGLATHEFRLQSLESARVSHAGLYWQRVGVWVVALVGIGQIVALIIGHRW
jgi:type VI protein secretion system component VasF